jgi:hypothetical protein
MGSEAVCCSRVARSLRSWLRKEASERRSWWCRSFAYLLGTSLLQVGYQRGAALTIAGIATLLTNALPIAAGPVLLNETLPEGGLGVLRILAFATVSAGAILLARPPRDASGRRATRGPIQGSS